MGVSHPLAVLAAATLVASVAAQRPKPTFEWQKRTTTLEYGAVPFGKHTLDELAVGAIWRLGMNEASTWRLQMPLLAGDRLIAPGGYRVQLTRRDAKQLAIRFEGSGQALGGSGGGDVELDGTLDTAAKPASKLGIEFAPGEHGEHGERGDASNQAVQVVVRFGPHVWTGKPTALGGKTFDKLGGGWILDAFDVPGAVLTAREQQAAPIAVLRKKAPKNGEPEAWNVIAGKDTARLVPWMAPPTESFGFGAVVPPAEGWATAGTLQAAADAADGKSLAIANVRIDKGNLLFEATCLQQKFTVSVPLPQPPKKP